MNLEPISVLIIDNYDSFTYNLVHYLEAFNCQVKVIRNNEIKDEIITQFDKIVISPGPGLPKEAGQLNSFIEEYALKKSILGICLGQQAIAELFGGQLAALNQVSHGVSTTIQHSGNDCIYKNIPFTFQAGLYHSWHTINLTKELIPTAISKEGIIMSIKHKIYDLRAVQFHPESIMTPFGKQILMNWINCK